MSSPEIAAVIFGADGTLISSGAAGGRSWDHAARRLYGRKADIIEFSDTGMTDPEVAAEVVMHVHDVSRPPRSSGR